jgi:hypothetical protein
MHRRRRAAAPIAPKPTSIIAQAAGSGTPVLIVSVPSCADASLREEPNRT